MTVKEWREQNPDTSYTMVYAADAGSFGRKGGSVYGSREVTGRLEIISIEMKTLRFPKLQTFPVLHVWDPIICRGARPGEEADG